MASGRAVAGGPGSTAPPRQSPAAGSGEVLPGIDVWQRRGYAPLAGRRVGLITNHTGRNAAGELTAGVLAATDGLELVALFSPEHGFRGVEEGEVNSGVETTTGLPVHSLYGDTRRPTDEMLRGLEGLVFDIQDIGTRFYTYATTLAYAMEAAAARDIPVVVLDRPNPINGVDVQGPVLAPEMFSFVGYAAVPLRHGMTIAELARWFNAERGIGADLTVVPLSGWSRDDWYDATGLLWIDPSPNIRNLDEATLYPAVGPLETTNVSVGRGTDTPFEWFGAPWIDARELARRLHAAGLPGLRFVPRSRTPEASVFAGRECHGVDLVLTDRRALRAGLTAITLATTLWKLHGDAWDVESFPRLWGRPDVADRIRAGAEAAGLAAAWESELEDFRRRRQPYLLYGTESGASTRR